MYACINGWMFEVVWMCLECSGLGYVWEQFTVYEFCTSHVINTIFHYNAITNCPDVSESEVTYITHTQTHVYKYILMSLMVTISCNSHDYQW